MSRRSFLLSTGASAAALATGGVVWYVQKGQSIYRQTEGPYSAWQEWTESKGGGVAGLLRSAVLAASPHNTQPWRFRVGESFIELFLDVRRRVAGLDPYLREAHLGMGCALENLVLAARAAGFSERVIVTEGSLLPAASEPLRMMARVELMPGPRRESELYAAIPHRRTNRGLYDSTRKLEGKFVDELGNLEEPETRMFLFAEGIQREELIGISVAANRELYADTEVEAGNQEWIRWDAKAVEEQADGIAIDNFGLPPAMAAIAKAAPAWVVQRAATPARRSEMYEPQMRSASLIGVIAVRDRMSVRQSIAAGRLWQRAHLLATARGVAARPCNEAIEMIDFEQRHSQRAGRLAALQSVIGEAGWEPTFLYLMGQATQSAPPSPRRRGRRVLV